MLNPEDVDNLSEEELDRLLEELEPLTVITPYDYVPHAKQLGFHNADYRIRAVLGGNRSGKTECGIMEAYFHLTGEYPDWYKGHKFDTPTRGRIIVTDYKKGCSEVLEPKVEKWFPKDKIVKIKRYMGHLDKVWVKHISGGVSTFDVLTHDQDDMVFEGWSGHWAWFDEPPPREKFIATWRGLTDFRGYTWLTLTPIEEPWLYDELIYKKQDHVWTTTVGMEDNAANLPDGFLKEFMAPLTEEEIEARVYGRFKHLTGRVYKELDEEVHVVPKEQLKISPSWPVWFVLDPADRRPHHAIWFTVDPFGVMYVFDELVHTGTIKDTSKLVLLRERMAGINPNTVIRVLDPNKGETPTAVTGLKLKEEFAKWGLYFTTTVNDDVALGHLAVKQRLHYDKTKPIDFNNRPRLYFAKETTKECVKQLLTYVWDDWKGASKGEKDKKEKVKDINKDMPDCLRYGVMSDPQWYNPDESDGDPVAFSPENVSSYGLF